MSPIKLPTKSRSIEKVERGKYKCVLCSPVTWEKARKNAAMAYMARHGKKPSKTYEVTASRKMGGCRCQCGLFVCTECICMVRAHLSEPDWPPNFREVPENSKVHTVARGHCCTLKQQRFLANRKVRDNPLPDLEGRRPFFGGACYLYQFEVAVGSTPYGTIDAFSYGRDKLTPAVSHAVFSIEQAVRWEAAGVKPSRLGVATKTIQMDLALPPSLANTFYGTPFNKTSLRLIVAYVNQVRDGVPSMGLYPSEADATGCTFVNPLPSEFPDHDAYILIGKHPNGNGDKLLLFRWFIDDADYFPSGFASHNLYKTLHEKSTKWEARRAGGSNGELDFNKLSNFLHQPGKLPRRVDGCIVIPRRLSIECYYISPYKKERKLAYCKYSSPHEGGQLSKLSDHILEKYPCLVGFALYRLIVSLVCLRLDVSVEAATNEMKGLQNSNNITEYVSTNVRYTLVTHCVGYHNDVGREGNTAFIENRIVLPADQYETARRPYGRGGGNNGQVTFALLGWR